jgi:hypothetical protein
VRWCDGLVSETLRWSKGRVSDLSTKRGDQAEKTHVKGSSLPLQSVNDIEGGDSLPLGVLSVGDGVPDGSLQERSENSSGL